MAIKPRGEGVGGKREREDDCVVMSFARSMGGCESRDT